MQRTLESRAQSARSLSGDHGADRRQRSDHTCGGEFCDQTSANARVAQRRGCGHVEDFGQGQLKLQCRLHGAVACQKGHAPRTLHPAPRVLPLHTLHMPGTAACRSAN